MTLSHSERGCSWDRGSGTPRLWPAGNGHDASSPAPGKAGMTLALWCVEDLRRAPWVEPPSPARRWSLHPGVRVGCERGAVEGRRRRCKHCGCSEVLVSVRG